MPATTTAMLKFPQDRLATFTCSFGLTDRSVFEVIGTNGVLKMDPAYEMAEALKSEITLGERKQRKTFRNGRCKPLSQNRLPLNTHHHPNC